MIGIIILCCRMFRHASEKSSAASHREEIARMLFHHIRRDVDIVLHERAMDALVLCWGSSSSPLSTLPIDIMDHIVSYIGRSHPVETKHTDNPLVDVMDKRVLFDGLKMTKVDKDAIRKLAPGSATTIPLSSPNLHLTRPCYRDLARLVRSFKGYRCKRIPVTGHQKYQFTNGGKHTIYWIFIVFKMPISKPPNSLTIRK